MLKPSSVDEYTSYRYYNDDNIREYYVIILLKKMGFSLDEIKENKSNLTDELFMKQRDKLLNNILETKKTIKMIDKIRNNIIDGSIKLEESDYVIDNVEIKKFRKGEFL